MKLFKKRSFKFLHSTNEIKAIFPLNYKTHMYDSKYYRPYMTNNKLTQIEIQLFFQEIAFATNNFAYLRILNFSTILLSSLIFLINILLFIFSFGFSEEIENYVSIHPHTWNSLLLIGFGMILILNIIGFLAKKYNYRKARSTIESIIALKSDYFGSKRLKWELQKNSIESLTLYNLDMDLDTSFEVEYDDIESTKDLSNPDIQRSLLIQA